MLTLKRNDCSNNEVNVPTSNPYQLKAQATALNTEFQAVFCALGYIEVISLVSSRYEHKSEQTVASKAE